MPFQPRHRERVHVRNAHPMGVYWADGETFRYKRVPDQALTALQSSILLKFDDNGGAPNESFHGAAEEFGDIFLTHAEFAAYHVNVVGNTDWPTEVDRCGFMLPPGVYDINVHVVYSTDSDSLHVHRLTLRELDITGNKNLVSDTFMSVDNVKVAVGVLNATDIKTDGTRAFFIHLDAAGTTKKARWFMRIERTGD